MQLIRDQNLRTINLKELLILLESHLSKEDADMKSM